MYDLTKEEIEAQLEEERTRYNELFERFQADKDNPYWFEDYDDNFEAIDERIHYLEDKLKEFE